MTGSVSPPITDVKKNPSPRRGVGGFHSPDLKLFMDAFEVDESWDLTEGAGLGSLRGIGPVPILGDPPPGIIIVGLCTSLA
jgi:hypothetical protein